MTIFKWGLEDDDAQKEYQAHINKLLRSLLKHPKTSDPMWCDSTRYFPEFFFHSAPYALQNDALVEIMRTTPICAFFALIQNYSDYSRRVEPMLMANSEMVFHLLAWADEKGVRLRLSKDVYEKALLDEPIFAWKRAVKTNDAELARKTISHAKNNRKTDPGAAFLWLMIEKQESPQRYRDVIGKSPKYSILASRMLFSRGFEIDFVPTEKLSPRWAFHLLTCSLIDQKPAAEKALHSAPDWMAEYLVEADLLHDIPKIKDLAKTVINAVYPHPLQELFVNWFSRVTSKMIQDTSGVR